MERCSVYEAAQRLHAQTSASDPWRPLPNGKELVTKRRKISLPLPFELGGVDCTHPSLADRGISQKTAREFGVGFYPGPGLMRGRLVIPIHNAQGELIAYCGRSLDRSLPRYRVPPGFAKSEVLFNMHRAAATKESAVVVVEGFFDCMKVHQAGIPSVVALRGAVLYEPQRGALAGRFRQVILMLDGDITGRKASTVIAEELRPVSTVQVLRLPVGAQPDQLSPEAIRLMLQKSVMSRDTFHRFFES